MSEPVNGANKRSECSKAERCRASEWCKRMNVASDRVARSKLTHSLALQRSASLHSLRLFAPFTGSLTCFAHPLMGQWKFLSMCSGCYCMSRVHKRFSFSLETRPYWGKFFFKNSQTAQFLPLFLGAFLGAPCRAPKPSVMDFPCI